MQDLLAFIVIIDILKPIPVTWFQVLQVPAVPTHPPPFPTLVR